jgi:hypothetical protein
LRLMAKLATASRSSSPRSASPARGRWDGSTGTASLAWQEGHGVEDTPPLLDAVRLEP